MAYGTYFDLNNFLSYVGSFDTDTPTTINTITEVLPFYPAADFVGGDFTTLYALDYDVPRLVAIDVATGAETVIGPNTPAGNWGGAAGDPTTGVLYGSSSVCGTSSTLYTIDILTGAANMVGVMGSDATCVIGIAVNSSGQMYGFDVVNDSLLSIDKTSGVATLIGSIGYDANYSQGCDFDEVTDTLYIAAYNNASGTGELRIADTTTGNTTLVNLFGGSGLYEFNTMAIAAGGACSSPADLPWLSVSPTAGTVPPSGNTPVGVTFDSTGLALGLYDGVLCVHSNDPATPLVEIPVAMTVSQTAPSISLSKTVGTTPGVCATTSSITVPEGSTVYYCYTVTNTGDTAFAMHDLVDDQLGTIFTGFGYALAPGASIDTVTAGVNVSAVINVPTTNVGTWTAYNASVGDGVQGQATATVDVTAAEAIPTLHGFGLLMLVLLLAGAGVLALRRLT